jgi:catechol 2,3-dioxygenase-like lactoylglutathione lyase family enzyme
VEPRVHVITLAVDDLERALTFYRDGLGLATKGVVAAGYEGSETEAAGAIVPFQARRRPDPLALSPQRARQDAHIPPTPPASGEFSIGHIVRERSEVDALLAQAQEAGATLTDEAHERPWGSIPATSATLTVTSGKSSRTPAICRRRHRSTDGHDASLPTHCPRGTTYEESRSA